MALATAPAERPFAAPGPGHVPEFRITAFFWLDSEEEKRNVGKIILVTMASEIDLTGVEDDLNKLQEDEHVRKALDEGVDLRAYSNAIEAQLREAEDDAIQQCQCRMPDTRLSC